ncbi:MAG: DMT family transporter [Chloroflexi bacterium]|nr:DMT family transporter [Chloroflexota bacterium]
MLETILTIALGIIGGLAVGTQSQVVGEMSQKVGGIAGSFIVHVSGAVIAGLLLLARSGEQIGSWRELNWYNLGSGVFGVILYLTLSQTLPRLGATAAIALIIIGQLTMGILIDHFGLFGATIRPVDISRIGAVVLLVAGGWLVLR